MTGRRNGRASGSDPRRGSGGDRRDAPGARGATGATAALLVLLFLPAIAVGCGGYDPSIWEAKEWGVVVQVEEERVVISPTIADVHGDFVHMSIRKEGHDSGYTIDRSPSPDQEERDWSRVHHWFGELHPNTYLEGRIDDGSGDGPSSFTTYTFHLPRGADSPRENWPDQGGSEYHYITKGYYYADGNAEHPPFDAGTYEVAIYAWYTGKVNEHHPAIDDRPGVQYIHHERPIVTKKFVIE